MKYDDFLLKRRRGERAGGPLAPDGLHAGGCRKDWPQRSVVSGAAAPPGMAPCSLLPDQEDAIATEVGRVLLAPGEVLGDAAVGCQAWEPITPGPLWESWLHVVLGELSHAWGHRCFAVLGFGGLSFFFWGGLWFGLLK